MSYRPEPTGWPWVIALVAAVLLLMAIAGGAEARSAPPEGWGAAEVKAAESYWGGAQPIGCRTLHIYFDATLAADDGRIGEATMPTYPRSADCEARIAAGLGLREQCYTVVHEYGHLLGLDHSPEPSSIMYWQSNPAQNVAVCNALSRQKGAIHYG